MSHSSALEMPSQVSAEALGSRQGSQKKWQPGRVGMVMAMAINGGYQCLLEPYVVVN